MDRETVLKHSRAYRLEHKVLSTFAYMLNELLTIKGHPEYYNNWIKVLQIPEFATIIVENTLEYFEKEFNIIKVERLPSVYETSNNKRLINIY